WPDAYPWNDGVTNVGSWYGTQSPARIHFTPPVWVFGSAGLPPQARMAILPTSAARTAWRWPGALDSFVMTSIRPGTSGRPFLLYEGPLGSLDWPSPPM